MNLNLVLSTRFARVISGSAPAGPTTLSFSSCSYAGGRSRTGLSALAPMYCERMRTTTHSRITKPSLWEEVNGSPAEYLIACLPGETTGCFPILIPEVSGTTAGVVATATTAHRDSVWTQRPALSGACSYSVEFERSNYFCDPLVWTPTARLITACWLCARTSTPNPCGALRTSCGSATRAISSPARGRF